MDKAIVRLRKKYILTAFLISFSIIFIMIFALNLIISMTYRNEKNILADVTAQAAHTHANNLNNENIKLDSVEKNDTGDFLIPRDVRKIDNIIMHGIVSCENRSAVWYTTGGGIMFNVNAQSENKLVYKEYVFNHISSVANVDFNDFGNIMYNGELIEIDRKDIIGDYFLITPAWWGVSSDESKVSLDLESIEIYYGETVSGIVTHGSLEDIFFDNIPEILGSTQMFYLVTNASGELTSVNYGNMRSDIDDETARGYISEINGSKSGIIEIGSTSYSYITKKVDEMNIIVFLNDSFARKATNKFLIYSVIIAFAALTVVLAIILIIAKNVTKPVADSFERQKKFISNAGHELKTPITVISAAADFIERQNGSDRWTECIKNQSHKMHKLVLELLDMSRLLELDKSKKNFETCDLSRSVNRSLLYFESRFFEFGKTLNSDIEKDISIRCDENKLSQLVGILIDNALKYSDESCTITFTMKKERNEVVLRCENPCTDFSVSDTSMLFERFYRSDNDKHSEQEGFGLGLSIAKAIAEFHNGRIDAEYDEGIVIFTVKIPFE